MPASDRRAASISRICHLSHGPIASRHESAVLRASCQTRTWPTYANGLATAGVRVSRVMAEDTSPVLASRWTAARRWLAILVPVETRAGGIVVELGELRNWLLEVDGIHG